MQKQQGTLIPQRLNLLLLGSFGVGKSSITSKFLFNVFNEEYIPTVEDKYDKPFIIDGEKIEMSSLRSLTPN